MTHRVLMIQNSRELSKNMSLRHKMITHMLRMTLNPDFKVTQLPIKGNIINQHFNTPNTSINKSCLKVRLRLVL